MVLGRKSFLGPLVLSVFSTCAFGLSCEPDCTGFVPGDAVPDPRNCTQYYKCMPGPVPSDDPFACGVGEIFDNGCIPGTSCTPICKPCHMTCESIGDNVADPFDCSIFYKCDVNGPGAPEQCPAGFPHYDYVNHACVNDESVCCNPGCSPICEATSVQVPDPINCTKYHQCNPDPLYPPKSCPAGQHFNIGTGHCEPPAECKPLCSQTGSTTTSTPAPVTTTTTPTTTTTTTRPTTTTTTPTTTTTTTTSTTTTPTTTTTTASPNGCLDTGSICKAAGFFMKCNTYCVPEYYKCDAAGALAILLRCDEGLLFNPVVYYPYCVMASNCPYTPFH